MRHLLLDVLYLGAYAGLFTWLGSAPWLPRWAQLCCQTWMLLEVAFYFYGKVLCVDWVLD